MFIRFDRMYEREGHTHTLHDGICRACIAWRGKNLMRHGFASLKMSLLRKPSRC